MPPVWVPLGMVLQRPHAHTPASRGVVLGALGILLGTPGGSIANGFGGCIRKRRWAIRAWLVQIYLRCEAHHLACTYGLSPSTTISPVKALMRETEKWTKGMYLGR